MSFSKTFLAAISSLANNKMRSFLTMLGIIIGVSAVIILVSLMGGLTNKISGTFTDMGTNSITVSITARGGSRKVSVDEMYKFVNQNSSALSGMTPKVTVSSTVKYGDNNITATATGVNEEQYDIAKLSLKSGRFLQYMDCQAYNLVCVIGTYEEKEFFENGSALGKTIKINGYPYKVIGVLTQKADSEASSEDDMIYIPYTSAERLANTTTISNYTLNMKDASQLTAVKAKIEAFLLNKLGSSDYYHVTALQEILDKFNSIMTTMSSVLLGIAGLSLLVGGIGIMNIMLVSVTERTREIGIRKSLGAKRKYIMRQFVMEAGTVSGIGGVIGIVFGVAISFLAGKLVSLTITPSIVAICVSFGVSVGIGIMFGFLPASKAAKLNPIDALRYD